MQKNDYEQMTPQEAKDYFNKNYNISYVDENLPAPSNNLIFMHYISSCIIYGLGVLLLFFNPFYINLLNSFEYSHEVVAGLFLSYLIIAPIIFFTTKPKSIYASHSIEIMNYILKIIKREGLKPNLTSTEFLEWLKPTYKQKQSMILYFIKVFFAPQLTIWAITHFYAFKNHLNDFVKLVKYTNNAGYDWNFISHSSALLVKYRDVVYILLLQLLFFFDCFFYALGYCTEATFLRNKIRTVESTGLGLFFCLACYIPFSTITTTLVPFYHSETKMNIVSNPAMLINWIYYGVALVLIALYVAASLALFTKASNLTNRGTCKIFPYNIVRHPAYSTKVLLWLLAATIIIKEYIKNGSDILQILLYILCAAVWTFIYYMRAITEERHLSLDPEYREYAKKVKYKFIPYVW